MNDELRRALDDLRFSDDEKARLARNLAAACEDFPLLALQPTKVLYNMRTFIGRAPPSRRCRFT